MHSLEMVCSVHYSNKNLDWSGNEARGSLVWEWG